jgi:broad specificity phosphatase PhoE
MGFLSAEITIINRRSARGAGMTGEIYLLRHGETEWNAQSRYQGKLDSPLTRRGRKQAEDVGRILSAILKGHNVALHVSPLGRTLETVSCAAGEAFQEA